MLELLATSLLAVISLLAFVPIVDHPLHNLVLAPFPLTAAAPVLTPTRVVLILVQHIAVLPVVPILIGCYLLGISIVLWLRIKGFFSDDPLDPKSPNGHRCHYSFPAFVMVGMGSSLVNAKCRCKPAASYLSLPEPNSDPATDQELGEAPGSDTYVSPLPPSPPTLVGRLPSYLPSRKRLWDCLSVTTRAAFSLVLLYFLMHAESPRIQSQRVVSPKLSSISYVLMDFFGILGNVLEGLDPLPWLNGLPFTKLIIQVNVYPKTLLCPPPLPPLSLRWILSALTVLTILAFSKKVANSDSEPGSRSAKNAFAVTTPTILERQVGDGVQYEQDDKAFGGTSDICEDMLVQELVEGDSEPTDDLEAIVNLDGGGTRYRPLSHTRNVRKDKEDDRDVHAYDNGHSVRFIGSTGSGSRDAMEGIREVVSENENGPIDRDTELDTLPTSPGLVASDQTCIGPNGSHTPSSPPSPTSYSPTPALIISTPVCETGTDIEEAAVSKDCDAIGALEDELSMAEIAEGLDRLRWAIQKEKAQRERAKEEAMKKKRGGSGGVPRRTKQAVVEVPKKGGSNSELDFQGEAEGTPLRWRWFGPRATEYQSMYALVESEASVYRSFSESTGVQINVGAENNLGAEDVSLDIEVLRQSGEDDGKLLLDLDIRELDRSWTDISLMEAPAKDGDGDGDSLLELDLASVGFEDDEVEDVFQGPTGTSPIRGRVVDVSFSALERETADAVRAMHKRRSNPKHVPSGRERTIYSSRTAAPIIKLTAPTPPRMVLAPMTQGKDGGWKRRSTRR